MFRVTSFIVALIASALLYSTMVLSQGVTYSEELRAYDVALDQEDDAELWEGLDELGLDQGDLYLFDHHGGNGRNFRCEIIVIIVDRGNNNRRQRHRFFGNGRNFESARRGAFGSFERHINQGRFWRNRFNTSFAYRNCG